MDRNRLIATTFATLACVSMIAAPSYAHDASAATNLDELPMLEDVAADAIQISPHVPNMGEHWAREADLPNGGPIYCVIEGRVTCVEFMFLLADLEAGTDWTKLAPGMSTPPISHIDIQFMPNGVGPVPEPLYQFHVYFAVPDLLEQH